jgi:hypothetical protein
MRWDPYRIWTTKIVRISLVVKKKKVPYILHASYNLQVIATVFLRPWIRFVTELSLTINFIIIKKNLVLLPKPMCIAASSRWIIIWSRTPNLSRLPRRNKGDCYGGYFEGLPFLGGAVLQRPGKWIVAQVGGFMFMKGAVLLEPVLPWVRTSAQKIMCFTEFCPCKGLLWSWEIVSPI